MATTSGLTCRSLWSSSQCLARAVRSSPSIRCHRGLATTTREIYSPDQMPPRYQGMRYGSEAQSDPHSVSTLVQSLRHYLGPKRGIQGTKSEIVHLKSLMARCQPGAEEWKRYGRVDPSRSYTRLHVDGVNGKCNLLFLVWNAGAESPIHNHADALCVMKIVKGTLNETVFGTSTSGPMPVARDSFHHAGKVAFISDDIGVHRMRNPNQQDYAVSLHLYTPPHAADYGFHVYDEKTGKGTHVPGRIALAQPPPARDTGRTLFSQ